MPTQRMTLDELESRCFTEGGHVEFNESGYLAFWVFNGHQRAYAVTDVTRPGVSSR